MENNKQKSPIVSVDFFVDVTGDISKATPKSVEEIGTRIKSIGKTSFIMEFCAVSDTVGLAASGNALMVIYDYNALKKTDIPEHIKEKLSSP